MWHPSDYVTPELSIGHSKMRSSSVVQAKVSPGLTVQSLLPFT